MPCPLSVRPAHTHIPLLKTAGVAFRTLSPRDLLRYCAARERVGRAMNALASRKVFSPAYPALGPRDMFCGAWLRILPVLAGEQDMEANVSWDDGRIDLLKKLWSDGLSASQIAAELGGVTRNAVIGKVHRLGLSGRAKTKATATTRQRVKAVAKPQRLQQSVGVRGNLAVVEYVEVRSEPVQQAREDVVIPMSRKISIMDLKEGVCRWPIGDPLQADFVYCGADCGTGRTYCEPHSRLAFQPQSDRRRMN